MKLIKLLTLLTAIVATFIFITPSYSATIPVSIRQYIFAKFPQTVIRFDGLITLPDGTKYIPVFPAISEFNATVAIKTAIPATNDFATKPDIVVFDSNFALLKLKPAESGGISILITQNYPMEIKTGMLPQDLIVPHGLILPEELSGILGDLDIPTYPIAAIVPSQVEAGRILDKATASNINNADNNRLKLATNTPPARILDRDLPVVLKNKRYLVTNLDTEYINVIPSYASEPKFTLKLDTIANDMKATSDETYVLITKAHNNFVDLVDLAQEEIIKQIDLGVQPNEILITPDNKIAFITSLDDHSIFLLDIGSMRIIQKIQVEGMPEKLALSNDNTKLLYYDKLSSNLYCIDLKGKYISTLVGEFPNASKFLYVDNKVYALLRTANQLQIMPYTPKEFSGDEKSVKKAEQDRLKTEQTNLQNINNDTYNFASPENTKIFRKKPKVTQVLPYRDNKTVLPLMVTEETKIVGDGKIKTDVSAKPVDMLKYGDNIYVLAAKNNELNIVNTQTGALTNTVKLPIKGFSKKITQVAHSNIALITNVTDKSYIIFDLSAAKVLQVLPVSVPINNIIILKDK